MSLTSVTYQTDSGNKYLTRDELRLQSRKCVVRFGGMANWPNKEEKTLDILGTKPTFPFKTDEKEYNFINATRFCSQFCALYFRLRQKKSRI